MAIVEMKRIDLLAVRQDSRKLMKAMQKMGCVEISPIHDDELEAFHTQDTARLTQVENTLERLTWGIAQFSKYNHQKAPFMGNKPDADGEDVAYVETKESELMALLDKADELERLSGEYKGQLARLQINVEQLLPWQNLEIPVEEVRSTRNVTQQLGTVNKTVLSAKLLKKWEDLPVYVQVLSEAGENACIWLAVHASVKEDVLQDLRDANFSTVQFGENRGTIAQMIAELNAQQDAVRARQAGLTDTWQELSQQLTRLKIWYDMLQIERDRLQAENRTIGTGSAFMMRGWVPAAQADQVAEELRKLSPTCSVDVYEPAEDDEPPVMLNNNKYVAPFESIITGFSLPSYKSIDPTAAMAPFYACLFGMMLSDAGYGLLMAIAIPILVLWKKPAKENQKLLWVLFFSALATVFWGAVYNTWFGFNPMPVSILDPINNPMPVMMVCMGVGVFHLFGGLGVAAYQNIKRGDPWAAVFDQLSWVLVVSGLVMLVLGGTIGEIGKWMAIAGVAIIIIWAGRAKSKNPFKRVISGLGALYGATSWISDILSYMRLFGMGLATGVIGMVINQLVGMVFNGTIIGTIIGSILFVGAHVFNLGINALGAYVHSCRLQYIEFFGKFYEDGGVPFRPLTYQTRYVNIKQA